MSFAFSAVNGNQAFAYATTGNYNPFAANQTDSNTSNINVNVYLNGNCQQAQPQQSNYNDFFSALCGLNGALDNSNSGFSNLGNIVAASETGTITGDPHFKGGDGGKYDVQGYPGKSYDLLSDTNLSYNGKFEAWGNNGATVVGSSAINVCDLGGSNFSSVTFDKTGVAKVNGQELQDGQSVILADGGTATLNGKTLTVTTAEGYTIKQTAMPGGYINSEVKTSALGVGTDNRMPDGLLGQTFDADDVARNGKKGAGAQGEGAIEGKVEDYETALNTLGDKQLGPNGQPIQQNDYFTELVNYLCGLLSPQPGQDFLQALSFVMSGIFYLLSQMGNQSQQA
jgi:hypothetical protein